MMNNKVNSIVCFIFFMSVSLFSQGVLTKEEAMSRFLQSNFDIRIAGHQVSLNQAEASKSAVGFYPTIFANGVASMDYGGSDQVFQDGREINADNNLTQLYSASAGINYNIYQGGDRRLRLDRLFQEVKIAEIQKRQSIENGLLQLMTSYYQGIYITQQIKIQENQLSISKKQIDRIKINREYGRGSQTDLLSAETLFGRDSSRLIVLNSDLQRTKRDLVNLMGESQENVSFTLDSTFEFNVLPSASELIQFMEENNVSISMIQSNQLLIDLDEKLIGASRKPTLGVNADYKYQFQDFGEGGFFAQQKSNGVGAGLTLNWNIYDGGRAKNQREVLKVRREIQKTDLDRQSHLLRNAVYNLKDQLDASLALINVEKRNIESSKANLDRIQEDYSFGSADLLILRQAQLSLQQAEISHLNAQFNAKNIELQLLQLGGMLLNEGIQF